MLRFRMAGSHLLFDQMEAPGKQFIKVLVLCALCLSTSLNGYEAYQFNLQAKEYMEPWGTFMRKFDRFVDEHKHEKGFSYFFLWRDVSQAGKFSFGNPSTNENRAAYLSDLLHRKYVKNDSPKYYLIYDKKKGIVAFQNKEEGYKYLKTFRSIEYKVNISP